MAIADLAKEAVEGVARGAREPVDRNESSSGEAIRHPSNRTERQLCLLTLVRARRSATSGRKVIVTRWCVFPKLAAV